MKLSILTPSIPERFQQVNRLRKKIEKQIGDLDVEHLILIDNKKRTIGEKRQSLVHIAKGNFFAFVDDDDDVSDDYIKSIYAAAHGEPDVITFRQNAKYNDQQSEIIFKAEHQDAGFNPSGETFRGPWHVCAWRKAAVIGCQFLSCNYGEDLAWSLQARRRIQTTIHIDRVLHYYRHSSKTTAAPESR